MVLEYDALFAAEQVQVPGLGELLGAVLGSGGARPELVVGTAPVLSNVVLGECGVFTGLCRRQSLLWPLTGAGPGVGTCLALSFCTVGRGDTA